MKRRDFLKKAGIGAVAASAVFGPVYAQTLPRVRWRMTTHWTRALDVLHGGAEYVAKRVGELTEGRFEISVHPAGELVPAPGIFDAVRGGAVEMGHTATYFWIGVNPSFAFDTTVPFGMNARQQNAWLYFGGGLDTMRRVLADFNIIQFPAGNTMEQMFGWFRREIRGPEDFRGLRMRIPGQGGAVLARLGATVQVIPAGEIFLALERGTVDAAEFVGPHDDERLGLHRAARFYYYPGWHEPGATLAVLTNLERWRALPKQYQEAVESATREARLRMFAHYDGMNMPALARLMRGGTQVRPLPTSVLVAANRATTEVLEEIAAKDATFRGILGPWRTFREQSRRWFATNAFRYEDFVRGLRET
ncbi:TRAP transporter substrate-binding protein [uncultured Meiothermus sp.]|uniref:TRAP transporter substrate-binding protein n=1 Tax=uncultured Meiothermus sp. TaxID=157471 RepID=UPI002633E265|nr:twin-arginine translocation signal domain-containing protein [uncultured Meiothermus sp.]